MPLGAFRLNGIARSSVSAPAFVANSDPLASNLILAVPFNEVTGMQDIAYTVTNNPYSTASTVTLPSNSSHAYITTEDSNFYGSSYVQVAGGGGSNKLIYSLKQPFNLTGTLWTFEFWIKTTRDDPYANSWFLSNGDVNGFRMLVGFDLYSSTRSSSISMGETRVNITAGWHHVVIQDNYWWVDGSLRNTVSKPNGVLTSLFLGHQKNGDANDWEGFMNDFRLYVGVRKYASLSSFTPPGPMGTIE